VGYRSEVEQIGSTKSARRIQLPATRQGQAQADFRRNSSSFSLHGQLEQLKQQTSKTATPAVMITARRVPKENKLCARECMVVDLIERRIPQILLDLER
jgi:hypothetical protein